MNMFMTLFVVLRYVWPVSSPNEASKGSASSGLRTHMCGVDGIGQKMSEGMLHLNMQLCTSRAQVQCPRKQTHRMCSIGRTPKGTKEPPCSW